ncbi:hypothetical protein ACFXHB_06680, partial [Kitasatospora sp. NPDC059327]
AEAAHRHRPASAPERAGRAPGRGPAQGPEQPVEAEQAAPEADPAADPAAPDEDAVPDGATVAAGSTQQAVGAVPAALPARWRDASTLQLPLGAGLGLIGCGLGLVGLRLRKG